MNLFTRLLLTGLFTLLSVSAASAQKAGSVRGKVSDSLGGRIPGALITLTDSSGKQRTTLSNKEGIFLLANVAPGKYKLTVGAPKFDVFTEPEIEIIDGTETEITAILTVASIESTVDVVNDNPISTTDDSNASAIVLNEKDIENLPDDPEELEAYLQMLAGGAPGMDGGQFYMDGITGGRIPPKSSIREIRINRSPFSAENERAGYGGIEIFTKPGTDKFRFQSNFNFNDARLNSRNPFALTRAPSQSRNFGVSFSGPIKPKVASFFIDFNNSQQDNSRNVNANVVDSAFNIVPFRVDVRVPSRNSSISSRVDYQLNKNNTLNGRYSFNLNRSDNQGVSDFSLPSRAFETSNRSHDIRLTESMIVNSSTVNETIFGINFNQRDQEGDNSVPTINVSGSFMGGGSQIGFNFNKTRRWEIQNNTTTSFGKKTEHNLKFGVRLRSISIEDRSESNFGGMFTFAGVRDPLTGALVFSSIEQYRQKVMGNSDPRFNPNQFSITSGDALSGINQRDLGAFVTDEWRLKQNLTISFGVRYENQTNVSDNNDFAPRFGFAYAPGAKKGQQSKTVFRGGFGIFYNRLSEGFFLQAKRFGGTQQTQYIVSSNPEILGQPVFSINGVTNVPSIASLSAFAKQGSVTLRRISDELVSPISYQFALSLDRQLPVKTKLAVTYLYNRGFAQLGIRNMNAPLCPPLAECPSNAPRPNAAEGNVYLYESIGSMDQQQLVVTLNTNVVKAFSLGGNYRLGFANSNIDGAGSFPSYSYDLRTDYGASSSDIRHNFTLFGSVQLPWKIRLSPNISASSGRPFNITTGSDGNRDSIFNDRPTFGQVNTVCSNLGLKDKYCDLNGIDNPTGTVIPRNYGRGPSFFNLNLSLHRTFTFKKEKGRPYNLIFGVQANNILNHTNRNAPISNLSSNRFGQVFSTMGNFNGGGANRRIELQMRFNF